MMKSSLLGLLLFGVYAAIAQPLYQKQHNFTSFPVRQKVITPLHRSLNSAESQRHPEFGLLPRDAKCTDCVEVIDKRTENTRYYVNAKSTNRFFQQQSFFPLHYKNEQGQLITIDPHLRKDPNQNIYRAPNQPIPTVCDLQNYQTQLLLPELTLTWNKDLQLYYVNENLEPLTAPVHASYQQYTIGEDGLRTYNIWQHVDMEQFYRKGEVKTDFILTQRPQFPSTKGYLVVEDHIDLPEGYTLERTNDGSRFSGWDLVVKNPLGEAIAFIEHPACRDADEIGLTGKYDIRKTGTVYTLRILVDLAWLSDSRTQYPVVIDPLVTGITKIGDFIATPGGTQGNLGFTSLTLGRCNHNMSVFVQGKCELINAYFDVEDQTTSNPNCGVPLGLPGKICLKREILHWLVSDTCNVTVGPFFCSGANSFIPNNCDTPGIITTDPNTVLGASKIPLSNPGFLGCIAPQCPDYNIPMVLQNSDSSCGDQCGFLCARCNMWQMTIEGCQVEGTISQNKTNVCPGEPVTFTANPNCGVPPYRFVWDYNNSQIIDTVYGTPTFTINPTQSGEMYCYIFDTCGIFSIAGPLTVTVTPAPPASAGPDVFLCEGGQQAIGGSPTSSNGASVVWAGETPVATSYLSSPTVPNPLVTVPAGVTDTLQYIVTATQPGFTCGRTDTVLVYSIPNPTATIDSATGTLFCAGGSATLFVNGTYSSYWWNNGSTSASVTVSQPGSYFAIVTDANGCRDTTNAITVSTITIPPVTVFPDTTIQFGDSVTLYTDINLNGAFIDSFLWVPANAINCSGCTHPVVSPTDVQYYGIEVYAQGCTVSDSALIRVLLPNNFFIPNAFTPNGDGNNDVFYIYSQSGVRVLSFQVFNRAGEKVHAGAYPWDGTYKGKPAPPGVYVWVFQLGLFGDDQAITRKGSVTLIR